MPDINKEKEMELFDIENVPIFASGKWNGDTYTIADLDYLVDGFSSTKEKLKPFLKLGHDEDQKLAQKDGMPAMGWVESLTRKGKILYAKFSRVPKKIMELIRAGAYRRVSAEIFFNMELNGKKFPRLLKAVSLLGGDTPAVHDLDDIMALYKNLEEAQAYETDAETKSVLFNIKEFTQKEDIKMSDDMQKQLAEANKKLGEAEAKLKEYTDKEKELKELTQTVDELGKKLKEAESKNKELTEQIYTYSVEKKKTEINAELDKAVADKKIYPAQKEVLFALMMNVDERKFKFGNGEKTAGEILKEFIGSNKVDIHTEEESERGESHKEDVERSELDRKAQKYSQEHKVSYTEALKAIS